MATWSNLNLQEWTSPLTEQLTFFHDHTLMILSMVTILLECLMFSLFFNKYINRYLLEGQQMYLTYP